jgi:hypothetical protein
MLFSFKVAQSISSLVYTSPTKAKFCRAQGVDHSNCYKRSRNLLEAEEICWKSINVEDHSSQQSKNIFAEPANGTLANARLLSQQTRLRTSFASMEKYKITLENTDVNLSRVFKGGTDSHVGEPKLDAARCFRYSGDKVGAKSFSKKLFSTEYQDIGARSKTAFEPPANSKTQ